MLQLTAYFRELVCFLIVTMGRDTRKGHTRPVVDLGFFFFFFFLAFADYTIKAAREMNDVFSSSYLHP